MGEKLDVYNLGETGVNLTKSPIHVEDGELVAAQNAEFFLDEGQGAIRKRAGLQRLNTSVLAGSVRGVIGVPLPGPGGRSVYAQRPGSPWFRVTTNGTTWADTTEFPTSPGSGGASYVDNPINVARNTAKQFFWTAIDGSGNALLLGFDGIAQYEVLRIASATMRVLCVHAGDLVVCERSDAQRVWLVDPVNGSMTLIGSEFAGGAPGEEIFSACSYLGKVWIGTANASTGKIYSARAGATAWTLERTAAANLHAYSSMAVFGGKLYAGLSALAGTAAIIEERTVAGVWSTTRTGGVSAERNAFDGLAVCNAELYAAYANPQSSAVFCEIHKYTGSAWSKDKDLQPSSIIGIHGVVVAGTTIFYNTFTTTGAKVWRKAPSGSFTNVDSTVGTVTFGVMGVL